MRTNRVTCFLLGTLIYLYPSAYLVDSSATAFSIPQAPPEAEEAAHLGKQTLEELVKNNRKLAQKLGFRSVGEATNLKIGTSIPILSIRPCSLRAYGGDVETIFKQTNMFAYPVTGEGTIIAEITVRKLKKRDKQQQVENIQEWDAEFSPVDPSVAEFLKTIEPAFIVQVYDESEYLGTLQGKDLILFALTNYGEHGISIGKQENARDVVAKLAEEARSVDYHTYRKTSGQRQDCPK